MKDSTHIKNKAPWYRQVTTIISIVALIISVFSGVYTQIAKRSEEVRSKKEELRGIVTKFVELQETLQNVTQIGDLQMRTSALSLLNNKRAIYLQAAESLAEQIPTHVTGAEYNILATENVFESDFTQAEHYYLKAIEASRTPINRAIALSAIAGFYFAKGPSQDFEKGRRHFERAVDVLKNPPDDHSIFMLGYTYEQWGFNELWSGFKVEGHQKIERARKYYSDLSSDNPARKDSLERLAGNLESWEFKQNKPQ